MKEFSNRRVVVIGGSRGIGLAVSRILVERGARLAIGARDTEILESVRCDLLRTEGAEIHVGKCDIGYTASTCDFVKAADAHLGGIDVLINCASRFTRSDDEDAWIEALNVDLLGVVRALKAAVPMLKRSGNGTVVTMSSVGSRTAHPQRQAYGAAKAALEQYTRASARRYAPDGIRVNCVVSGSADFPGGIWDETRKNDPQAYEAARRSIPLGGFAEPRDIAEAVVFLASERARWITGQCILVDGGQAAAMLAA
ncbi:SDR family NAD(P)-dependent oxidoreductase [Aureimonas glaciei]|uniref:3-oxoacyl-ACP reductase n=1 Tax=Aureimonas glaciei TaxID=1776957 RepID=A0A916YBJ4_9HYPH|nr:SDR family oxidoreductase [Aureimonas glaciei]GGD38515.1 3-oxoacyl-ACP reductase [Aureimonas glaciei]